MSTKTTSLNRYQKISDFINYVNELDISTVSKQNIINDVYRFLNWTKKKNITISDVINYYKMLKRRNIGKKEAIYIYESLDMYLNLSSKIKQIDLLDRINFNYRSNKKILKKFKIFAIAFFTCIFVISAILIVLN